ncbi:Sugar phosphate permease [Rhizobiales bacterium GAS191]|nr:Sugar phosphate permease [Rhizobiales bacterium GAS191]
MQNRRWLLVVLMFFSSGIGYLDRAAIGIAAPLIAKDFELTPPQLGVALSAFFVGYSIFALIGGHAADRFGPKRVIVVAMSLWSIFCGLTGAALGLVTLVIARLIFGIGEGPFGPSQAKLVGRWFPRQEQATAIGLYGAGEAIGGALAGPLVSFVAIAASWRLSFVLMSVVGLALAIIWAFAVTEWPEQHRGIGEAERRLIEANRVSETVMPSSSNSLFSACLKPAILATAFAWFGYAYILFFFLTWFPSYLITVHQLSIKDMGMVSALPWIAGFVGRTGRGFVSDLIFRWTGNALFARKLILCGGLGIAALCISLAGAASSVAVAVGLTSVSVLFLAATANIYWALMLDLVPQHQVGGVSGFGLFVGSSAGIFAPIITGYLVQWTGAFSSAFMLSGAVAVAGALGVFLFVRRSAASSEPARAPVAQTR